MTQSLWVIRNREDGKFWNGFGFHDLIYAHTYGQPPHGLVRDWLTIPVDILELRLIERDSDGN